MQVIEFYQLNFIGNLHFAYAKSEDGLSGRIYKCTIYNQYLDVKAGGGYTKVVVDRGMNGRMICYLK